MTRPRWGRLLATAYVVVVASLTAYAFRSDGLEFGRAEGLAAVLTLPATIAALPVIYLGGALAWHLHDAGAPMLLVTVFFTLTMTATALGNLWLLGQVRRVIRPRPAP
jgi:ABC-type glycerol-3-phosphate transport system permease component